MKDPARLIDDPETSPELRRALRAESARKEPKKLQGAVWGALAAQLAQSANAAASTTAAGAAAASTALSGAAAAGAVGAKLGTTIGVVGATTLGVTGLAKSFATGLAIGIVLAGGGPVLVSAIVTDTPATAPDPESAGRHSKVPGTADPAPLTPRASAPPNALPKDDGATGKRPLTGATTPSAGLASAARARPATGTDPSVERAHSPSESFPSLARIEALRVSEARQALRRGDGETCLTSLAKLDQQVPNGVLIQEREALRIEALVAVGRREEAQRAAAAFLRRYPESPHARRVRGWTALPPPQ